MARGKTNPRMTQMPIGDAFLWARQEHMAGRLAAAEEVYRKILAVDPNYAPATHYLGVVAYQVGRFADAEPLLRRALALQPGAAEIHHNLGLCLQELAQLDQAEAEF